MVWFVLFVVLSAVLLALAWPQLHAPIGHGFFRFFAFEALFGLVLLSAPVWFADPLSPRQILSWLLLAASAALAANGFAMLHRYGEPARGIEPTQRLVERGAYRWVRHPLYGSLILLGAGAALKHVTAFSVLLLAGLVALLLATAQAEEKENLERFGDTYREYMRRTRRFIPLVY